MALMGTVLGLTADRTERLVTLGWWVLGLVGCAAAIGLLLYFGEQILGAAGIAITGAFLIVGLGGPIFDIASWVWAGEPKLASYLLYGEGGQGPGGGGLFLIVGYAGVVVMSLWALFDR